jgi:hypothetical protein
MRSALPLSLACLCSLAACSNGDSGAPVSPGAVFLEITALHPQGSDAWLPPRAAEPADAGDEGYAGDAEPVVIGCDRRLGVDVRVDNFSLRAPDACGSDLQCGYLVIDVDPSDAGPRASAYAAAPSLFVDLEALDQAGTLEGEHVIHPRLSQPDGKPFTHPYASAPLDVTLTFTSEPCDSGNGGAAGAAPSAAGAAP